jgi:hypothetical protein
VSLRCFLCEGMTQGEGPWTKISSLEERRSVGMDGSIEARRCRCRRREGRIPPGVDCRAILLSDNL